MGIAELVRDSLPIVRWSRGMDRDMLRADLIAGITLAAFAIPELLAYAQLAGLPPEYGLYAGIVAPLAYLLFGGIRQLSMGPSSSEAILLASVLGAMALTLERYAALAALTALMVAAIAIAARMLKLGYVVNLISATVLKGFLAGTAMLIMASQLPRMLGVDMVYGTFFDVMAGVVDQLGAVDPLTIGLSICALISLFILDRLMPRVPAALLVVAASIVLVWALGWSDRLEVVGSVPPGLPALQIPQVGLGDVGAVLPLAAAMFLLSYVELMAIGREVGRKTGLRPDPDQELLALGTSNLASGLFQGFPVTGSYSRTMLNMGSGARTLLSATVAALVTLMVAAGATGLLADLPIAILGVLIVVAVYRMVDLSGLRHIMAVSRAEAGIALVSLGGVLLTGVLYGIAIGVALSLMHILFRLTRPHMAILGRVPGTNNFGDQRRHPENEAVPGVLIVRVDAPLIFANADSVRSRVMMLVEPTTRLVVMDLEASPIVDVTAAEVLCELASDLQKEGVEMRIAQTTGAVRDTLRAAGYTIRFGAVEDEDTVAAVLSAWED